MSHAGLVRRLVECLVVVGRDGLEVEDDLLGRREAFRPHGGAIWGHLDGHNTTSVTRTPL